MQQLSEVKRQLVREKWQHATNEHKQLVVRTVRESKLSVKETCERIGVDRQTYYRWASEYTYRKTANPILEHLRAERDRLDQQIKVIEDAEALGMTVTMTH